MRSLRIWPALLALAIVAALGAPPAAAQGPKCRGQGMPKYDPAAEATLKGTVDELEQVECCCPAGNTGTHLTLKTEAAMLRVHLGPSSYLAERKFELAKGDAIEIIGSRLTCMGEDVLLAREVRKGEQVLTLRDKQGIPEWSGGRGRGAGN